MWKNEININEIIKTSNLFVLAKTPGWIAVRDKALRLRQDGKVKLLRSDPDIVAATVGGDKGDYDVEIYRQADNSQSVTMWNCSCPWGQYAFQQKKKQFNGRLCAHALATLFEANSKNPKNPVPSTEE